MAKRLRSVGAGTVPYSGRLGYLLGKTSVVEWGVDLKGGPVSYVNSATAQAEAQLPGWRDWSADFQVHNANFVCIPGATLAFGGSFEGTKGVTGNVIIDEMSFDFDIEGAKPIIQDVKASGTGAYALGASVATDASVANALTSVGSYGTLLLYGATGDPTEIPGITKMSIKLQSKNVEYKNSDTVPWVYRLPGPLSGTVSYTLNMYDTYAADLPAPNTFHVAKLFIPEDDGATPTLFWQMSYICIESITGIKVNRETGAVVSATLNAKFSGYCQGVQGTIIGPDSKVLWPFVNADRTMPTLASDGIVEVKAPSLVLPK